MLLESPCALCHNGIENFYLTLFKDHITPLPGVYLETTFILSSFNPHCSNTSITISCDALIATSRYFSNNGVGLSTLPEESISTRFPRIVLFSMANSAAIYSLLK
jgi:hypothetical protein